MFKNIRFLCCNFLLFAQTCTASVVYDEPNRPWRGRMEDVSILEHDLSAPIETLTDIRTYLQSIGKTARFRNTVYLARLKNGTKAVFKPKSLEEFDSALGEVAAYRIAKHLGETTHTLLVPPTRIESFGGLSGSLQWFVESPYDLWIEEQRQKALLQIPQEIKDEAALFCHAFQWDTHPGNYIIGEALALIDNEGIVNKKWVPRYGERAFVRILYDESQGGDFVGNTLDPKIDPIPAPLKSIVTEIVEKASSLSPTLHYMVGRGGWWVQHHSHNPAAFPVYSQRLSPLVREAYTNLPRALETLCGELEGFHAARFGLIFRQEIEERIQIALDAHQ